MDMADTTTRYPAYDPSKADLLVCPLSGRPILRAKQVPGGDVYVREQELLPALEQSHLTGSTTKIWIAKEPNKP